MTRKERKKDDMAGNVCMVYIKMQEEITVITKLVHKVRIIVCSEELQEET